MATDFDYDPTAQFPSPVDQAVNTFSDRLSNAIMTGPPDEWWMDWAVTETEAKLKTTFYIPLNASEMRPWSGHHKYRQGSYVTTVVRRKKWQDGVSADADYIAEKDLVGFKLSPEELARAGNRNLGKQFGALLTAATSTTDWTGSNFFAPTGSPKKIHPKKSTTFGTWYNYTVSQPFISENILAAVKRLQGRRGIDNNLLGFEGTHLIVPQALFEEARLICEVLDIVPLAGPGGSDTGGNRSRVYKRLQPVKSLEMRSDLWIVAQSTTGMGEHMQPFAVALGGSGEAPEPNKIPPQVEIQVHTTGSEMYKTTNKVAVSLVRREGVALLTPHCFEACQIGA